MPARPQCAPQCELTLPDGAAHQQQIAHVHAGDEKHQRNDDRQEGCDHLGSPAIADVGDAADLIGHDRRHCFRWRSALRSELRLDRVEFGRCLHRCRVVSQPSEEHQCSSCPVFLQRDE